MAQCLSCGTEIGENWPRFTTPRGEICMGCEGAEVDVYVMTVDGKSYADRDAASLLTAVASELECMERGDLFSVNKQAMRALLFYSLPEFGGF